MLSVSFTANVFFFHDHVTLYNYLCQNVQKNTNNKRLIYGCCAEVFKREGEEWQLHNCSHLCMLGGEGEYRRSRSGVFQKKIRIAGCWNKSWCSWKLNSENWEYTPEQNRLGMRELNTTPWEHPKVEPYLKLTWNKERDLLYQSLCHCEDCRPF